MANYEQLKLSQNAQPTIHMDRFTTVQDRFGNLTYKQNGYYATNDRRVISSINSTTQVPSSLNNSTVDFKVDNKLADVLDMLDLQIEFLNSTGANSSIKAAPCLLNRYEVISAQGVTIFTSQMEEIYLSNLFLDKNAYEALASVQDLNVATYAPNATVVANLGTGRYNILLHGFFKACKVALCGLTGPLTVRFMFNPSTLYLGTGADMTCTGLTLVCHGRRISSNSRRELQDIYNNGRIPVSLSHLSCDRMVLTQNLAPSTTIQIPLNGLRGVCSFLIFTIKLSATYLTTAPLTYIAADSFDIADSSSSSLIGGLARNRNIQRIHWASCFQNEGVNQTGINFVSFAVDPRAAFSQGSNSGYCIFTGNEVLKINLSAATTAASHQIEIRAWMQESVLFDVNGDIKALRD